MLALVATLQLLLESCAKVAVLAATVRNVTTLETFVAACSQFCLTKHRSFGLKQLVANHSLSVAVMDLKPMNPDDPTFRDSALNRGVEVRVMRITLAENG